MEVLLKSFYIILYHFIELLFQWHSRFWLSCSKYFHTHIERNACIFNTKLHFGTGRILGQNDSSVQEYNFFVIFLYFYMPSRPGKCRNIHHSADSIPCCNVLPAFNFVIHQIPAAKKDKIFYPGYAVYRHGDVY